MQDHSSFSQVGARILMSGGGGHSPPSGAWGLPGGPVAHQQQSFQVPGIHDRLDALEQELLSIRNTPRIQMTSPGSSAYDRPMPMSRPHPAMSSAAQQALMSVGHGPLHPAVPPLALGSGLGSGGHLSSGPTSVRSEEHQELLNVHKQLLNTMDKQQERHTELLNSHRELMKAHKEVLLNQAGGGKKKKLKAHPSLGVIRLDYNYPPAEGDTDCPASFGYDVFFRVIPGLTFEMAQMGKFTETVERNFAEGIKFLEMRNVSAITGDCGFMMAFQMLARKIAAKPVFMSSMVQCPVIACAFEPTDQILILTANALQLKPQKEVLLSSCGFDVDEHRFIIKGCQDVPGFDAVAKGEAVPIDIVQPGILNLVGQALRQHPSIRAILLECTELPPYADALRAKTGLPVWDCITAADFYVGATRDNPRFGIDDWQAEWDGEQDDYSFGMNLIEADRRELVNKVGAKAKAKVKAHPKAKAVAEKTKRQLKKHQAPTLGVIRLDYNYPPAAGDIDCPGSYDYEVLFRCVPGLTFEMAQRGKMSFTVQQDFVEAIKWLEARGVCGITGDCGFMMAFQPIAREVATVPVFMSAMVQCPMISVAFDKYDQILILTANSQSLKPQKDILLNQCGFDVDETRFVIYGCQDVPGFDAVAKGEKVDVEYVTPGIVHMVNGILKKVPTIRAICLECTELPPYADALRKETGLPVFDAITCADFFVSARKDNPRFGLNQWQNDWDGQNDSYELGGNLSAEQRARLRNIS
mmetsp:Transcript_65573/g.152328  ORF Transcript_65573/g.152328 Transcript_65573/m.152328 type:complete len:753 (-) Transcript_65573:170-2428(-)